MAIIPISCWSCGKILANKWATFQKLLEAEWAPSDALNELEIRRICCRRMMLTHVDVIDKYLEYGDDREEEEK